MDGHAYKAKYVSKMLLRFNHAGTWLHFWCILNMIINNQCSRYLSYLYRYLFIVCVLIEIESSFDYCLPIVYVSEMYECMLKMTISLFNLNLYPYSLFNILSLLFHTGDVYVKEGADSRCGGNVNYSHIGRDLMTSYFHW